MANNAFADTTDEELDLDKPVALSDVVKVVNGELDKLLWWWVAPLQAGYLPFLVSISTYDRAKDEISFQFVNCEKGTLLPGTHLVGLDDMLLAHRGVPSTPLPPAPWPTDDSRVVLLMLNHQTMHARKLAAMLKDAVDSNAWPESALAAKVAGKWPGGAPDKTAMLRAKVRELASKLAEHGHPVPKAELDAVLAE